MSINSMGHSLVTGGNGFVGQRLRKRLQWMQVKTMLLQRADTSLLGNEAIRCFDLTSTDIPTETLSEVDVIFHIAGVTHDVGNKNKAGVYRSINVDATVCLANAAVEKGVRRLVFVSSVKAGGLPPTGQCASELDQHEPEGIYGKTKRDAELALLEIADKTDLQVSIVRPTLVYGPAIKGNLLLMLRAIDQGRFPPLPENHNRRSMIHVDDLVEILLQVATRPEANGEIFIATDGVDYSSRQIYEIMCHGLGKELSSWHVPEALFSLLASFGNLANKLMTFPFDSYRMQKLLGDECYSSSKLREKLAFTTKRTFSDSIDEIVAAYRQQQAEDIR